VNKKSKLSLLLGPRLSGKTKKAVEMALACGGLVGAVCPTKRAAVAFESTYGILAIAATTQRPAHKSWRTLIIVDAHQIPSRRFIRLTGDVMPHGADVIVTACPPTTKTGEWVTKLKDAGFTVEQLS
jgi:hypothetical protein